MVHGGPGRGQAALPAAAHLLEVPDPRARRSGVPDSEHVGGLDGTSRVQAALV